jgi:hypothetical protein
LCVEAWICGPGGERDRIIGWKVAPGRGAQPVSQGGARVVGVSRPEGGGRVEKNRRFLGKGHQAWLSSVVTWERFGKLRARAISRLKMGFMLLTFSTTT